MTENETEQQPREGVLVLVDHMPDGSYSATIVLSEDEAHPLTANQALDIAADCAEVAATAEHDAAVFTQMMAVVGMEPDDAALVVAENRADRPTGVELVPGFRVEPIVSIQSRKPLVAVLRHGKQIGQWTPADLRSFGDHVLRAVVTARLDTTFLATLTGHGLEDAAARRFVSDLSKHWPDEAPLIPAHP